MLALQIVLTIPIQKPTRNAIIHTAKNKTRGIQSGAVTHHQDQVITLQSLRTRNIKNKTVLTPIPLLEVTVISLFAMIN